MNHFRKSRGKAQGDLLRGIVGTSWQIGICETLQLTQKQLEYVCLRGAKNSTL